MFNQIVRRLSQKGQPRGKYLRASHHLLLSDRTVFDLQPILPKTQDYRLGTEINRSPDAIGQGNPDRIERWTFRSGHQGTREDVKKGKTLSLN